MSESITSWRIARKGPTWIANDLSGKGSAKSPGRWNSHGRPIVYSASSIALACLETLVNIDPLRFLQQQLVRITIPSHHWQQRKIFVKDEHSGWDLTRTLANDEDWPAVSRAWGDDWLENCGSLLAEVPSVIIPEETNILLNPRHPAHMEVVAEIVRPWFYDDRLVPNELAVTSPRSPLWHEPLDGEVVLEMVGIPSGEFLMGSCDDEADRVPNEGPQHLVKLHKAFYVARTPVTQAQWRIVAGWIPKDGEAPWVRPLNPDPSSFQKGRPGDERRPVENVSWFDAQEFCRRLSQRTGHTYSLPSEAQWEYACRAGKPSPYAFGSTLSQFQANVYSFETKEVGNHPPNAWGLLDMHGNVWEWCEDHWHEFYWDAPQNGSPWINANADEGEPRCMRGGSWKDTPIKCRSAYRDYWPPDYLSENVGFRVCRLI